MDILSKGQYLGQTYGFYENKYFLIKGSLHNQSESDYHKHDDSYLSVLLKGGYVEMSKSLNCFVTPGTMIFRSKNYVHKNRFVDNNTKCLNIEFNDKWFLKNRIDKIPDIPIVNQVCHFRFIYQIITDFIQYNKVDVAEDIFIDFVKQNQTTNTYTRAPWLAKLTNILDNEISTTHSLKSLSERVFVQPNYMARVFKSKIGISIGQYQIEKKLSLANKDLFTTNKSITDIAIDSGFYDEAHFIRTFKSKYGVMSPSRFRKIINS